MNGRRKFLKQAGVGLSAGLLSPYLFSCGDRASHGSPFHRLGLQLYSIRDLVAQDPLKTLETVAKIGYRHVETFGIDPTDWKYWGLSVAELKKALNDNGLKSHSGHYDLSKYLSRGHEDKENLEKYIEIAHQIGQEYVIAPLNAPIDELGKLTVEDYQYAADQLNRAGEMAKKAGIKIGYHNHFWEFRPFANGTKGLDILIGFTEPGLVDFEMDIYWTEKAGFSPQSYFEKYPGRFPLWHVKDMDKDFSEPIIGGERDTMDFFGLMAQIRYAEVGTGSIDYPNIAAQADKAGLKYAIVEQDDIYIPNKFESLKKSHDYVKKFLAK